MSYIEQFKMRRIWSAVLFIVGLLLLAGGGSQFEGGLKAWSMVFGVVLIMASKFVFYCPSCGKGFRRLWGNKFCRHCGEQLE